MENTEILDLLKKYGNCLSYWEKRVLSLRYEEQLSYAEIEQKLPYCLRHIMRIRRKALEKLAKLDKGCH